jgi:hypothetical protein
VEFVCHECSDGTERVSFSDGRHTMDDINHNHVCSSINHCRFPCSWCLVFEGGEINSHVRPTLFHNCPLWKASIFVPFSQCRSAIRNPDWSRHAKIAKAIAHSDQVSRRERCRHQPY